MAPNRTLLLPLLTLLLKEFRYTLFFALSRPVIQFQITVIVNKVGHSESCWPFTQIEVEQDLRNTVKPDNSYKIAMRALSVNVALLAEIFVHRTAKSA